MSIVLNFLHRGELKKKKGKEGREDKRGAACCISIPPAERLSVCLWQQPREGDTLCILTQLVYLSLCHCLSLSLSVSACLSLPRFPWVCLLHFTLHSATACQCFSPLSFFAVFLYLPFTLSQTVIFLFIFHTTNFYVTPFLFTSSPNVPPQLSLTKHTIHYRENQTAQNFAFCKLCMQYLQCLSIKGER